MVRRSIVFSALLAAALCAFARPAAAAYGAAEKPGGSPFAVAVGWSWNQGNTPRNDQLIAGIRYSFTPTTRRNNEWVLSADWLNVDSEGIVGIPATRRHVSIVPALLNYKLHFSGPWYGFAGAGARWAEKDIPEMRISNRWDFVWQLGAGYDFGQNWFVEGRWIAGTHPSDDGIFAAQLGLRF